MKGVTLEEEASSYIRFILDSQLISEQGKKDRLKEYWIETMVSMPAEVSYSFPGIGVKTLLGSVRASLAHS